MRNCLQRSQIISNLVRPTKHSPIKAEDQMNVAPLFFSASFYNERNCACILDPNISSRRALSLSSDMKHFNRRSKTITSRKSRETFNSIFTLFYPRYLVADPFTLFCEHAIENIQIGNIPSATARLSLEHVASALTTVMTIVSLSLGWLCATSRLMAEP